MAAQAARRDLVVVGASAGGVEALREFVAGLPADLDAAVLVVLHLPAGSPTALPDILGRAGALPAAAARQGDPVTRGRIAVAPADHHLLLHGDTLAVSRGPRENGHRPSVDVLFRSAARWGQCRVLGVLLSGALDDGAAGLAAISRAGGLTFVQDPADALYEGMPRAALATIRPDGIAAARGLAGLVVDRLGESVPAATLRTPADPAPTDPVPTELGGRPSGFSCPECGGVLFEFQEANVSRYRCRLGHAWSSGSLLARQDAGLEEALWMALRSLEEKASLCHRMGLAARSRGSALTADRYDDSAARALAATDTLRALLLGAPVDAARADRTRRFGRTAEPPAADRPAAASPPAEAARAAEAAEAAQPAGPGAGRPTDETA